MTAAQRQVLIAQVDGWMIEQGFGLPKDDDVDKLVDFILSKIPASNQESAK